MNALKLEALCEEQFPLVKKFYKSSRYSPKVNKQDEIYVLRETPSNEIVGAVRLTNLDHYLILRSMVIHPSQRRRGYGTKLLNLLSTRLENRECWCFPFSWLYDFYKQEGFVQISEDEAPSPISEKFIQYTKHGKQLGIMRRTG